MANTSKKDFIVWMSFEANVCIRAESEDDALAVAHSMLDARAVYRMEDIEEFGKDAERIYDNDFQAQTPEIVEEHDVSEEM